MTFTSTTLPSFKAAPGDVICMCIAEPKLVELLYDAMGIEQNLNRDTGYTKMCGTCKMELEGPMGMAALMKEREREL